ncbi:MAG: hypothetical protein CBC37_06930 [Acidimicrobiaceae bacterium TMED77]|nr:hypothetical protein [Acidimicrobiales bacterium]OUU99864.1 MAG: hypothetical protein CBC37_06930 [Acidimicrobiaceae bacterium TMED77]
MLSCRSKLLFGLLLACLMGISCSSKVTQASDPDSSNKLVSTPSSASEIDKPSVTMSDSGSSQDTSSHLAENTISFKEEVLPIIQNSCASCHTDRGPGVPHAKLDSVGDVSAFAFAIGAVVETGAMPPWPASELSVPFLHDVSLDPDQKNSIVQWVRSGAPLDLDIETPVTSTQDVSFLISYDQELSSTDFYDGEIGQPDEYRCFIFDPELTETKYLTEYEFIPDQTEVVHHLVGYKVSGEYRAAAERKNASEEEGGWSCFGSTGLGDDQILTFWGPGTGAIKYQEGAGLKMDPGDFFVMQIHYHYDIEAPEDRSVFRTVWSTSEVTQPILISTYLAPAEIPCAEWEKGPLCERDNAYLYASAQYDGVVQANQILEECGYTPQDYASMTNGIASSTCDLRAGFDGIISAVLGHQHNIGASFRMTLNPDTQEEVVLLDIPDWDFEWQYAYYPIEEINVDRNDIIRLDCVWDRSLRPADLEPSYVLWADGSNDEMCFAVIMSYQKN